MGARQLSEGVLQLSAAGFQRSDAHARHFFQFAGSFGYGGAKLLHLAHQPLGDFFGTPRMRGNFVGHHAESGPLVSEVSSFHFGVQRHQFASKSDAIDLRQGPDNHVGRSFHGLHAQDDLC